MSQLGAKDRIKGLYHHFLKPAFRTAFVSFILLSFWVWPVYCQVVHIHVNTPNGGNTQTPIGGMGILAALGVGYAVKKLWDVKRKQNT